MLKVTVELEYEKYDVFGRTKCEASIDTYEDYFEEDETKIVEAIRKLFTNKNYFNPCVSFVYRDTDMPYHNRVYTSRVFGFGGDTFHYVKWLLNCDYKEDIKHITKKRIHEMYMDCINRGKGIEASA